MFLIDVYSSPSCDSPSNQGEGQTYLGLVPVNMSGSGNASFNATGLSPAGAGSVITATATDLSGNTSEFSGCQALATPAVVVSPTAAAATEGGATRQSFTVRLTAIPTSAVVVTPSFTASQLSLSPATLTFQPDASALSPQTVTVTAVDDAIGDGTRMSPIAFAVSSPDPAYDGAAAGPVTVTLTDNDGAPSVSVADLTVAKPATASGTSTATLTVSLAPSSSQTVTVRYATADGTATGGASCGSGAD